MKDYEEWKKDYLAGSDTRKYLVEKQLREEFEKQFGAEASLGKEPNVSHSASKSSLDEPKHSLSEKAAGMKKVQRFLSAAVIIGFFLPWIEFTGDMDQMKEGLNQMMEMLGELAEETPQYREAKEQMELLEKMDGASGFDLSTTKFGRVGDSPSLFMVPVIALWAGIYNMKKVFIIYPVLCGFCLLINTISGPISMGLGLVITYASLLIAFFCALGIPKDTDIAAAKGMESSASD